MLATDLGPDGDRALERALQIREAWNAQLVILHVREPEEDLAPDAPRRWLREEEPLQEIRRRLRLELGDQADHVEILLEEGDAAKRIDETAEAAACDLIVVGAARRTPYSLLELGETLDRVLRRTVTPVLVVRGRTRGAFRQAVFATDMSEASAASHAVAVSMFPEPVYAYLYAFDAPLAGLVEDRGEFTADAARAAEKELEAFAMALPVHRDAGTPALVTKYGAPARTLCEHVALVGADLVVMTASSRGLFAELLLGSVVKDALECLTSDVLLVPERQP
ncbi:hypothetical protein ASE17_19925 [Phenylobacterium sp. Root77]|nr:hypothetical protein ASE17_19925 [Phenylobacterium sp. Root77]